MTIDLLKSFQVFIKDPPFISCRTFDVSIFGSYIAIFQQELNKNKNDIFLFIQFNK